jgi:hypothetical protein
MLGEVQRGVELNSEDPVGFRWVNGGGGGGVVYCDGNKVV